MHVLWVLEGRPFRFRLTCCHIVLGNKGGPGFVDEAVQSNSFSERFLEYVMTCQKHSLASTPVMMTFRRWSSLSRRRYELASFVRSPEVVPGARTHAQHS